MGIRFGDEPHGRAQISPLGEPRAADEEEAPDALGPVGREPQGHAAPERDALPPTEPNGTVPRKKAAREATFEAIGGMRLFTNVNHGERNGKRTATTNGRPLSQPTLSKIATSCAS